MVKGVYTSTPLPGGAQHRFYPAAAMTEREAIAVTYDIVQRRLAAVEARMRSSGLAGADSKEAARNKRRKTVTVEEKLAKLDRQEEVLKAKLDRLVLEKSAAFQKFREVPLAVYANMTLSPPPSSSSFLHTFSLTPPYLHRHTPPPLPPHPFPSSHRVWLCRC